MFSVNQFANVHGVTILSLSKNNVLVGEFDFHLLLIYSSEGHYLSNITISGKLMDASWTPKGYIVYTTYDSNKVEVIREYGDIISSKQMGSPRHLSVSNDGAIYLSDENAGLYESKNDGFSWDLILKSTNGQSFQKAFKVTNETKDDFWIYVQTTEAKPFLVVYSREKTLSNGTINMSISWKAEGFSMLFQNDGNTVFTWNIEDEITVAVHTEPGQIHCQRSLYSLNRGMLVTSIFLDGKNRRLYVGYRSYEVQIFQLTYSNKCAN